MHCEVFCYNRKHMKAFSVLLGFVFLLLFGALLLSYGYFQKTIETTSPGDIITRSMKPLEITSTAFEHMGSIPSRYTCDGEDINPPLKIQNIPEGTQSLVLIAYDPDVPKQIRSDQNWDHWIVFNIPPDKTLISENDPLEEGTAGITSNNTLTYGGPCPPKQFEPTEHRYFFKTYALDSRLDLQEGATRMDVEAEMNGHVLDFTELIGVYERK